MSTTGPAEVHFHDRELHRSFTVPQVTLVTPGQYANAHHEFAPDYNTATGLGSPARELIDSFRPRSWRYGISVHQCVESCGRVGTVSGSLSMAGSVSEDAEVFASGGDGT